jgi:hypothetical protein
LAERVDRGAYRADPRGLARIDDELTRAAGLPLRSDPAHREDFSPFPAQIRQDAIMRVGGVTPRYQDRRKMS